jgi:DNA-binding protein WhiA
MSFTSDVKYEICQSELEGTAAKAHLCALLLHKASLSMDRFGMSLVFQIENAAIAKHVYLLLKKLYDVNARLAVLKKMQLKKNNIYRIQVYDNVSEILNDLSIWTDSGLHPVPGYKLTRSEKNARAFLSGSFLASGSINHPRTANYHLEISTDKEKLAHFLQKQLARFYIPAKIIERKNMFVVYVKAGEKIADFLRLVNAPQALFVFEDTRIQRDLYNQITRLDNCELANEMKSIKAAKSQLDYIEVLEKNQDKIKIPPKIEQVIAIRKKYPEASINELCQEMLIAYGESISKSGMKHRLAKIKELAEPFLEEKT